MIPCARMQRAKWIMPRSEAADWPDSSPLDDAPHPASTAAAAVAATSRRWVLLMARVLYAGGGHTSATACPRCPV